MPIDINLTTSVLEAYNTNVAASSTQAVSEVSQSAEASGEQAYEVETGSENASKFQVDYEKIKELKAEYRKGYTAFKQMVSALFDKQSEAVKGVLSRVFGANANFEGITDLGKTLSSLNVDDATRKQAEELIGENGAWGVKQVSENILNFAKAAAGGDSAKLEKMKDAFLKGFSEAEKVWGGKLPEISYKTKEAVLKGFDELLGEKSE